MAVSKYLNMFLSLPGSYLEAAATGKRVNEGVGCYLEVPCKHCLTSHGKTIDRIKKKIASFLYQNAAVVNKCLGKYLISKKYIC